MTILSEAKTLFSPVLLLRVTSSASVRKSARHAESAVKGKGPVPSEQLVSIINSCLLATLASSQYCNIGQDPVADWMSVKEG